jgi:hypothetical protein
MFGRQNQRRRKKIRRGKKLDIPHPLARLPWAPPGVHSRCRFRSFLLRRVDVYRANLLSAARGRKIFFFISMTNRHPLVAIRVRPFWSYFFHILFLYPGVAAIFSTVCHFGHWVTFLGFFNLNDSTAISISQMCSVAINKVAIRQGNELVQKALPSPAQRIWWPCHDLFLFSQCEPIMN